MCRILQVPETSNNSILKSVHFCQSSDFHTLNLHFITLHIMNFHSVALDRLDLKYEDSHCKFETLKSSD